MLDLCFFAGIAGATITAAAITAVTTAAVAVAVAITAARRAKGDQGGNAHQQKGTEAADGNIL